ncbi:MAG: BMP family ABC transporter substrate-binding protein [Rhodoferax sp.]|nr:BMP family ABC transporter substrate-binding protein [Actinomycetota bacterium]
MTLSGVATVAALALAACGSSTAEAPVASGSAASSSGPTIKVGLAYDIGGRGDKSFNDAAAAGLEKAKSELGLETKELEAKAGETDAQKEERLRLLASGGYDTIVAVGFAYAGPLKKVAPEFPKVHFAIIDDNSFMADNVANLVFAANEGSFLVGAAAALKSKTAHVGYIGGVQTPLLEVFQAGFDAGAKAVNPSIKIDDKYLTQIPDYSGFADPAKGKVTGEGMFQGGADVVFAAAGSSGLGVFQAAVTAKTLAIGVDSDQYNTVDAALKPVIMTSMIKKVDVAVFDFVKSVKDGSPLSGETLFDLKSGGIDYSTSGGQVDDIKAKLDDYKAKIISGEIKVPATPGS